MANRNSPMVRCLMVAILLGVTLPANASEATAQQTTWYRDADGDGYGSSYDTAVAETQPAGYVQNSADCDDRFAAIYPGAQEVCDGLDNDCDGTADQHWILVGTPCVMGLGSCQRIGIYICTPDRMHVECSASPGVPGVEICDCLDNDCDGTIDNNCTVGVVTPPATPESRLGRNAPNPFNPLTTIHFELARQERVHLSVFDLSGRLVRTLAEDQLLPAGQHKVSWDGRDGNARSVPPGVYAYVLQAGKFKDTGKMILVR